MVSMIIAMTNPKIPEIQPRRAPLSAESRCPVRRRYRNTARKPVAISHTSAVIFGNASCPATAETRIERTPASSAIRTAGPLWNPIGGGAPPPPGAGGSGGGGSTPPRDTIARRGLPPLLRKNAAGGGGAPQVQRSGTPSVSHTAHGRNQMWGGRPRPRRTPWSGFVPCQTPAEAEAAAGNFSSPLELLPATSADQDLWRRHSCLQRRDSSRR